MNAPEILSNARTKIKGHAADRDKQDGERTITRAVTAYQALRGTALETDADGWLLMALLKAARATVGEPKLDDFVDGSAYLALAGEAATKSTPAQLDLPLEPTIEFDSINRRGMYR